MTRRFICDWADGDMVDEVLLVRDKQVRTNRNGNAYLQLDLDDRSGSINGRYWNSTEAEGRAFDVGDFLAIKGKVQLFQSQMQLIINAFQKIDPTKVNTADFIPTTEKDIATLAQDLREHLAKVKDPHLQAVARAFLMDERLMDGLCRAPAGIRNHHAYIGGLLEHIVALLNVADRIVDLYPTLNFDLLRMGIFLHDLGKVRELSYDRVFSYSDEGQLIGHLVIGVEMLDDKLLVASELLGEPVAPELVLELKHLILSHHGTYEFGSPKLPMTPEAIALHHLDNLDAKVHNFSRTTYEDPQADSRWTPYDPQLGRRLYKGTFRNRPKPAPKSPPPPSNLKGGL